MVAKPHPVVMLHGIFTGPEYLFLLKQYIEDALPGVEVYNIDGFNHLESTTNMWKQLEGIRAKVIPIFEKHPEGVNMICYSQGVAHFQPSSLYSTVSYVKLRRLCTFSTVGGLTCRGVLQTTPKHNVRSFILLSSPQAGQYGGLPNITGMAGASDVIIMLRIINYCFQL